MVVTSAEAWATHGSSLERFGHDERGNLAIRGELPPPSNEAGRRKVGGEAKGDTDETRRAGASRGYQFKLVRVQQSLFPAKSSVCMLLYALHPVTVNQSPQKFPSLLMQCSTLA